MSPDLNLIIGWTAKRTHLFDHEQVRDQNKCVLCGDCVRACHEIQSIGAIDFRGVVVQPRCVVDHESLLLILKTGHCTCTRMSMDIRVHIGRNPRSQYEGGSKIFINFIFNNQCTIDC